MEGMEQGSEEVKNLSFYKDIIEEFLNGSDYKKIASEIGISYRTVRNYISGSVPDSGGGITISYAILDNCLLILKGKKEKLNSIIR